MALAADLGGPKGPLWNRFSKWYEGRIVYGEDGRKGHVAYARTAAVHATKSMHGVTYLVKWDGDASAVPMPGEEVEKIMIDEFVDLEFVSWEILAAQKNNWWFVDKATLKEGMDGCAWVPQDLQADAEQQRVLKGAAWANKHVREARAEMQEQCPEQEHVTKRATKARCKGPLSAADAVQAGPSAAAAAAGMAANDRSRGKGQEDDEYPAHCYWEVGQKLRWASGFGPDGKVEEGGEAGGEEAEPSRGQQQAGPSRVAGNRQKAAAKGKEKAPGGGRGRELRMAGDAAAADANALGKARAVPRLTGEARRLADNISTKLLANLGGRPGAAEARLVAEMAVRGLHGAVGAGARGNAQAAAAGPSAATEGQSGSDKSGVLQVVDSVVKAVACKQAAREAVGRLLSGRRVSGRRDTGLQAAGAAKRPREDEACAEEGRADAAGKKLKGATGAVDKGKKPAGATAAVAGASPRGHKAAPVAPKAKPVAPRQGKKPAVAAAVAAAGPSSAGKAAPSGASKGAAAVALTSEGAKATARAGVAQAAVAEAAQPPEDFIQSWTGRRYPRSLCFKEGDILVKDIDPTDSNGEFSVAYIVDEVKAGKAHHFLVKWEGYELNIGDGKKVKGDWELLNNVRDTEALAQWKKAKPAYYLEGLQPHERAGTPQRKPRGETTGVVKQEKPDGRASRAAGRSPQPQKKKAKVQAAAAATAAAKGKDGKEGEEVVVIDD